MESVSDELLPRKTGCFKPGMGMAAVAVVVEFGLLLALTNAFCVGKVVFCC